MRCLPFLAILLAGSIAHADPSLTPLARSCAEVTGANLTSQAQEHAREVLARVLERADLFVVDRDCTDVYRIEQQGEEVVLTGPRGRVRGSLRDHDQLGVLYASLVAEQSRLTDDPPSAEPPAPYVSPPQQTIYEAQAMPVPEQQRSLYYMRLGLGTVNVGSEDGKGGAVGFGARLPVRPTTALDFSVNFTGGVAVGGKALVMSQPPLGTSGLYAGAGLSASSVSSYEHSGGGLAAELSAGVAIVPSHRGFVQADLTVPFYLIGDAYPAMFAMSVGFGFAGR